MAPHRATGIGRGIAAIIAELQQTGRSKGIPGLGLDKIRTSRGRAGSTSSPGEFARPGRGVCASSSRHAHSVDALANQRYGVAMARREWVRRGDVLNTLDTEAFVRAVSPGAQA